MSGVRREERPQGALNCLNGRYRAQIAGAREGVPCGMDPHQRRPAHRCHRLGPDELLDSSSSPYPARWMIWVARHRAAVGENRTRVRETLAPHRRALVMAVAQRLPFLKSSSRISEPSLSARGDAQNLRSSEGRGRRPHTGSRQAPRRDRADLPCGGRTDKERHESIALARTARLARAWRGRRENRLGARVIADHLMAVAHARRVHGRCSTSGTPNFAVHSCYDRCPE